MKRFDYKTETLEVRGMTNAKVDFGELAEMLNARGAEGWELVSVQDVSREYGKTQYILCVFKREV